jgi:hypothetical protein
MDILWAHASLQSNEREKKILLHLTHRKTFWEELMCLQCVLSFTRNAELLNFEEIGRHYIKGFAIIIPPPVLQGEEMMESYGEVRGTWGQACNLTLPRRNLSQDNR